MATPISTTQPQQVSQACISLAAAAHGDEAWRVPGEDGTAAVTQAPNSSIPSSIHSNLANPVHSETPSPPSHLHFTFNNTADPHPSMETNQSMAYHPFTSPHHPHSMLGNPGDQSIFDLPSTSSHPHSTLGNLGDQSMSNLPLTSSHPHSTLGNPGDQSMDLSLPPRDLQEMDQSDSIDWSALLKLQYTNEHPSPGLATDAAAGVQIGQPASGSLGATLLVTTPAAALHVDAVGDAFPPGHGSHVHMEGDQSLDHVRFCTGISPIPNCAVLEAGSMEPASVGRPRQRRRTSPVVVGHGTSSSATGPDCPRLKSAQGFIQPETGTDGIGNPGPSAPCNDEGIRPRTLLGQWLVGMTCLDEATLVRFVRNHVMTDDCEDRIVNPHEPPTSRMGCYVTRFDPKLEGDKPKEGKRRHSHWSETDAKLIRDPSAPGNIIGLRRTLEYMMNGTEKTHWRANEYVAIEPLGDDALQILGDIAVRTVYEEDSGKAPAWKCPKSCVHCHSGEESYIWKHMTKVFIKGDAKSETALSLLYGICHKCDNKVIKCPRNFGTSNVNKHLEHVHGILSPCKSQHVMANKGKGVVA